MTTPKDPVCTRCGATLPDRAAAKEPCPKPGEQYARYIARRASDPAYAAQHPPVGHSTTVADHFELLAREQRAVQGPVVADLIAAAAEAEEVLSPDELEELDRAATERRPRKEDR